MCQRSLPASVVALVVALLAVSACSSNPTAPSPVDSSAGARSTPTSAAKPAIREMDYDINIPDVAYMLALKQAYPNGVWISPRAAQARWDFTKAYGGSPNVYFGEIAPRCQYVLRVGIVVAPFRVAGMDTFTSADWNVAEPGYTYAWVGRFVYTMIATPDMYKYDPTATCS